MKDFWKRKRNKRIAASALAVVMAGFLVWGLFPWQAAAAKNTVADNVTINKWHDPEALDDSTKNVGRIWTDKSVSKGDVTLTNKVGESATIEKGSKSDFLVGLSALSSTAKIMGQTTVPLDIVLVLDVSGSMKDPSGSYEAVYDLNTQNAYYVLVNGQYQKVEYWSGSRIQERGWYYSWSNTKVVPKTSADDTDSNHDQFYSSRTKMEMLQDAVNGFIEQAAKQNGKLSDTNKQSRISLVKFAGNKKDKDAVGDSTYEDNNGYTHNYTQIVSGYEACTSANEEKLKSKVNALTPAGATRADYAMDHAKTLVEQSKGDANRKNAKRIVIFFTDGEPTSSNQFEDSVAKDAIATATGIKLDADIYTIGVFKDADASVTGHTGWGQWSDKERFNAYMHGMSSNYPKATAYNNLGERAKDSKGKDTQFYKAATNASELNDIFKEIQEEIVTSAQSPTHVEGEKPNESGYITFTDQLGDYMQVDDMNTLLYANQMLTSETRGYSRTETTAGDKTTVKYTFDYVIPDTNHVYPEGNLKDIVITVEKATGNDQLNVGDLVTVKIPANLIPLRYYEIDKDGNMTIDETYPMRLFYDVSLKADAEKKIENPDALLQAYIDANKDDEGQVQFYSNKYKKEEENGKPEMIGAYSHFVPATTNDFYYFQNDTFLYKDEACTKPATGTIDTSGNTTYYYQRDYYKLEKGETKKVTNTVTIPGNSNTLLSRFAEMDTKTGQYYIPAGTPRTTSLSYFTENKVENQTGTASTFIKPTWNYKELEKGVTVYLGNNGRISKDVPGALQVSKTVTAAEGHTAPSGDKADTFDFTVKLTAPTEKTLQNTYKAQIFNANEEKVGEELTLTTSNQGILPFKLQGGQHIKIYGLDADVEYQVTESDKAHYTKQKTGDSGTIEAGKTAEASFTNEYRATSAVLKGDTALGGTKTLVGRDMKDGETFSFALSSAVEDTENAIDDGAIVIAGYDESTAQATATMTGAKNGETKAFAFDEVTFNKIGTYKFSIKEQVPDQDSDGMTWDRHTATVTVTVTDDGSGKLKAAVTSVEGSKTFENRYDGSTDVPGGTKASISASKTLNGRNLKDGEFTFKLATKPANGEVKVLQTKTNKADGTIPFDALSYRTSDLSQAVEAGYATKVTNDQGTTVYTLNYQVYEDEDTESFLANGVSATMSTFNFNVIVTDNGDGTLKAETQYPKDKTKFEFINTYSTGEPIPMDITGSKILNHVKGLTPNDITGKFTFTITALTDGAPMPDRTKVTNDAAGNVDFGKTTFKLSDLEGVALADDGSRTKVFEYKVTETGSAAGVTNDPGAVTGKTFTITLTDDGKGHLSATKDSTQDSAQDSAFTFTNTYTVGELPSSITDQIKIDKNLTGRDLKEGEFTFELLENGKVVATGSNDASGNVTFEKITYTEPGQHTYTVCEVNNGLGGVTYDDQLYTVHSTITDNRDGTMNAEHEAYALIDGKELAPVDKITFNNKYEAKGTTASIGAVKRLTGKDLKDGQFTFQLKDENGKVIDEAKNDKAGAISFKALEFDKAGTYKYTISEVNDKQKEIKYDTSEKAVTITVKDSGDGYLQAQVESEKQLIFTNTFEAAGGSGTKTGDNMNLVLPIMMMLTAAAIGSVLLIRRKYHR